MTKLNYSREDLVKKIDTSRAKVNMCREKFTDMERQIKADLEQASRIWKKLGDRFRWWQSLP